MKNLYTKITVCWILAASLLFTAESVCADWRLNTEALLPEEVELLRSQAWLRRSISIRDTDAIIRLLHQLPTVQIVKIETNDHGLATIAIERGQKISAIKVIGAEFYSTSEIRNFLGVDIGDAVEEFDSDLAKDRLEELYRNQGYLGTKVDFNLSDAATGDSVLTATIQETKATRISTVQIESDNKDLVSRLRLLLGVKMNIPLNEVSLTEIQGDIKNYLIENKYYRAEIIGPRVSVDEKTAAATLTYRLNRPDQLLVAFRGNTKESTNNIFEALKLSEFFSANPNVIPELTQRLKAYYLQRGYARVEINSEELMTEDPFRFRINFNINEGARIKINNLQIAGSYSMPEDKYTDFIQSHSSDVVKSGFYVKDDLDRGVANLITQLQNEGFLTAKMTASRVQFNNQKTAVDVILNLEEGPVTSLDKIDFIGNNSFSTQELLEASEAPQSGILRLDQLEESLKRLKLFYYDKGFIEMKILNEGQDMIQYSNENTQANVLIKIVEGPLVKVASILLEGNTFTRDYVILNELDIEPGETLTLTKLEESRLSLQRTGYFTTVEVKTLEEKTNVADRTLVVKVSEREPGTFSMGMGATNERKVTVRGYVGVVYRNLLGTGRSASARIDGNYNIADIKYPEYKVTLGYLEPYLFDSKYRFRVNLSQSKSVADYELKKVSEVKQIIYSIERDFSSHLSLIFDVWGLATVRDFGLDETIYDKSYAVDIASLGPNIDIDYRNNPFNPTAGHFTRLNLEYASPQLGSTHTIEYAKANASFTLYWTLPQSSVVWANQVRSGYLKNLSTRDDGGVPYDKKGFVLGGRSTIRGFEAGTSDVFPNRFDLGSDNYILTKEAQMNLIKSEFRIPFWGDLALALFYDGGSVTIKGVQFADSYRDSIGIGLHYVTPLGPLNIEYGYKLDRREGEDPGKLHLSVGSF